MKLITKPIATKLYKADQQVIKTGGGPDEVALKLFTPWGGASWYFTSGTPLDEVNGAPTTPDKAKDWHLFGYCNLGDPMCAELGYALLSELESVKGPWGMKIERDTGFEGTLSEVMQA